MVSVEDASKRTKPKSNIIYEVESCVLQYSLISYGKVAIPTISRLYHTGCAKKLFWGSKAVTLGSFKKSAVTIQLVHDRKCIAYVASTFLSTYSVLAS